jgi:hypothetical protein
MLLQIVQWIGVALIVVAAGAFIYVDVMFTISFCKALRNNQDIF